MLLLVLASLYIVNALIIAGAASNKSGCQTPGITGSPAANAPSTSPHSCHDAATTDDGHASQATHADEIQCCW